MLVVHHKGVLFISSGKVGSRRLWHFDVDILHLGLDADRIAGCEVVAVQHPDAFDVKHEQFVFIVLSVAGGISVKAVDHHVFRIVGGLGVVAGRGEICGECRVLGLARTAPCLFRQGRFQNSFGIEHALEAYLVAGPLVYAAVVVRRGAGCAEGFDLEEFFALIVHYHQFYRLYQFAHFYGRFLVDTAERVVTVADYCGLAGLEAFEFAGFTIYLQHIGVQ